MRQIAWVFLLSSITALSSDVKVCDISLSTLRRARAKIMPVEEFGPLLVRRGDLFAPFAEPINGDKVRQTLYLLMRNLAHIQNHCGGVVSTSCGVRANQGYIVSYVARHLGLNAVVAIGGKSKEHVIEHHELLRRCDAIGCNVEVVSKAGYPNVVFSRLMKKYPDAFVVKFGMNMKSDPGAVLDPNAAQVAGLPKDIDNLVVPVGSGVSVAGVIRGLIEHDIHPKRVYLVQIAGMERSDSIDEMVGERYPYEFVRFDRYRYARWIHRSIELDPTQKPVWFDGMNEAKVYEWMLENIDIRREKTVFWIVADSGEVRGYPRD